MVLRSKLMKHRWWRIRQHLQAYVQDPGHKTFGVQTAAKTPPDVFIETGLIDDLKILIGLGLGELLVNGNNNGHGEVIAGLVVANQDLLNFADGHAAKFDRGANLQAFERAIEIKYGPLYRMEQSARTEEDHSANSE